MGKTSVLSHSTWLLQILFAEFKLHILNMPSAVSITPAMLFPHLTGLPRSIAHQQTGLCQSCAMPILPSHCAPSSRAGPQRKEKTVLIKVSSQLSGLSHLTQVQVVRTVTGSALQGFYTIYNCHHPSNCKTLPLKDFSVIPQH